MGGVLYGVGLGPGDPELMTLKAYRLISGAEVVAYPAPEGGASFARSIAADVISQEAVEVEISVPMDVARFPAQEAYDRGALQVAAHLDAGRDVVVLCEGDPFFYGSFMYLFARLRGDYAVEIVPGVTSVTACAAVSAMPLSARNETLSVVPGTLSEDALRARIVEAEALAIMKVGRHLGKIKRVLSEFGLVERARYVERATLPNQVMCALDAAPDVAPYFSMILVRKGDDPWLT